MELSPVLGFGIFVLIALLLLASGMWVAFALAIAGLLGAICLGFSASGPAATALFSQINSFTLTCVPLFVLMGELTVEGGLSGMMYRGVSRWTSVLPGGLLHSNIVSCAILAAICGSSAATAATICSVAAPEQRRQGYGMSAVAASLAGGGTLGILIPPSIIMIVYGASTGASIGQLFIAGIIPGVALVILFMAWIAAHALMDPRIAPGREKLSRQYFLHFFAPLKDIWPLLLLIISVLGGIYGGLVTVTEAAAFGCFISLMLGFAVGRLNLRGLKEAGLSTVRTTSMVLFIVAGTSIMSMALGNARIPAKMVDLIGSLGLDRYAVWLLVVLMYVILGMFLESFSMMLLTLPISYPIMMHFGFDQVWFGIALVVLVELAQITPPVGINLFVVCGMVHDVSFASLSKSVVPYCCCQFFLLAIITAFPGIVLLLPKMASG